jgi:Protein of unknown function (DUF3443)
MTTTYQLITRQFKVVAVSLLFILTGCGGGASQSSTPSSLVISSQPSASGNLTNNQIQTNVYYSTQNSIANQPTVSVKVCQSGTCQTISNILVDTGSFGLRILNSALSSSINLLSTSSGNSQYPQLAECALFGSGYMWGGITEMTVSLGGISALTTTNPIPIQIVDDHYAGGVPSSCSNQGASLGSIAALGANGILGIGFLPTDVFPNSSGDYYNCTNSGNSSSCQTTNTPFTVVVNPVKQLNSGYNNGVIIDFTATNTTIPSQSTSGTLTFGIPSIISGNNVVALDANTGTFTSTYSGSSYGVSFIDTGSNAIFFSPNNSPTICSNGYFYCQILSDQTATIGSANITFSIGNYNQMNVTTNAVLPTLAGPGSSPDSTNRRHPTSGAIDWGLPFFFGRKVYIAISGQGATANNSSVNAPFISF